jgi:hypothetical protein
MIIKVSATAQTLAEQTPLRPAGFGMVILGSAIVVLDALSVFGKGQLTHTVEEREIA